MFSLFVWMELCMNTSKIRVFYARLEISAFLQPLEQLLGVGFLDLTKQSASGEKLSENLSAGQNLNRPPSPSPQKAKPWTCEIEVLSLTTGSKKKEWLTIYYGTQSTGKNNPWNQISWSWPFFPFLFFNPRLQLALLSLISDLKFTFLNDDAQ